MYSELKASQESRIVYLQLQDWLIRLYFMVTGGVCQDVTTLEMQHAIEDNITSKYENLILSRKNALLKAEKKLLSSKVFNKVNKDFIDENENENNNEKEKAMIIIMRINLSRMMKKKTKIKIAPKSKLMLRKIKKIMLTRRKRERIK